MKKIIKYFLLFFIVFTPILCSAGENGLFYLTPGIRIGWDFEKKLTISTKISVGYIFHGGFVNITYGYKYPFLQDARPWEPNFEKYNYVDIQAAGAIQFEKKSTPLYTGVGAGLIFYKENEVNKTAPRLTIFSGFIAFPTLDVIFLPGHMRYDIGLQIVAPLPLSKIDIGGFGG